MNVSHCRLWSDRGRNLMTSFRNAVALSQNVKCILKDFDLRMALKFYHLSLYHYVNVSNTVSDICSLLSPIFQPKLL